MLPKSHDVRGGDCGDIVSGEHGTGKGKGAGSESKVKTGDGNYRVILQAGGQAGADVKPPCCNITAKKLSYCEDAERR